MAIINLTTDSFSGDGLIDPHDGHQLDLAKLCAKAEQSLEAGATILDIGAESTRPGATPIPADLETKRVLPALKILRDRFPYSVISVDTRHSALAHQAVAAGANIINNVDKLFSKPDLAQLAKHPIRLVLMHNRSQAQNIIKNTLGDQHQAPDYQEFFSELLADCQSMIREAKEAGFQNHQLILDPGIGFGKTLEQNLAILRHTDQLKIGAKAGEAPLDLLIGHSRKGFISHALQVPPHQRLGGSLGSGLVAWAKGADILRVHDVAETVSLLRMVKLLCD